MKSQQRRTFLGAVAWLLLSMLTSIVLAQEHDPKIETLVAEANRIRTFVVKLDLSQMDVPACNKLATRFGLECGQAYGYTDFSDRLRVHRLGTDGDQERLRFPTISRSGSSNPDDSELQQFVEAELAMNKQRIQWDSMYYPKPNVTLVRMVATAPKSSFSNVWILQMAKGRAPDLLVHLPRGGDSPVPPAELPSSHQK